jgi:anthranilate synthase component 1
MVRNECVIKIVPGERYTPFSLAVRLQAKVILESSSFQKGRERYSLLMVREAFRLLQDNRGIVFAPAGGGRRFKVESRARDILDVCQYFADQHAPVHQDFPLPAGGVGYLGYEFCRHCDNIDLADQEDLLQLPEAVFLFGHVFVVFDHYTDKLYLIGLNYTEARINLEAELGALEAKILEFQDIAPDSASVGAALAKAEPVPTLSDSDSDYMERVEAIREEVIAGNLLQGVASRRLTLVSDLNPLDAYRRLRSNNPSPYLFFIDFGAFQLTGASPEVHVKVSDGKATLRPIAGTRRRGRDRTEDLALEAEMLADPKERAEHLMLVDLGRNDLGRVSKPGSVKVTEYMVVERYSHVMHMVSQVEGELMPGRTGLDAFRATFPAGTVTGAPKISAIEILSRIERFKRGHYAGAIGYIEPGGNLNTCIGIRTALKMGKHLVLQAGAGVVYDSTPERELEESREKLAAVAAAFGLKVEAWLDQPGDDDVTVSVGYSATGGSTNSTAARSRLEPRPERPHSPPWQEESGGNVKQIQNQIDSLVEEKEYSDQAGRLAETEREHPELADDTWGGEETWGDKDPLGELGDGHEIDEAVEQIVDGMGAADEPDPWAEADAEAERLSAANRPEPVLPEAPDPWAEADAEAAALSGNPGIPEGDDIIPLDWDFDPSAATGAAEIQDEIDNLINADRKKDADGGRG